MNSKSKNKIILPKPFRPNWLIRYLLGRLFSKVQVDPQWEKKAQQASEKGTVVYVLRSVSFLDFLLLDFFVKQFRLPGIRFVNNLGLWIFEPFGRGIRKLFFRKPLSELRWLEKVLDESSSALLFLKKPPRFGQRGRKGEKLEQDFLLYLVECQKKLFSPVMLVSQTVLWTKQAPKKTGGWADSWLGPAQWPGKIRSFFQFFLNFGQGHLQSGEQINLQIFVHENRALSSEQIAKKLHQYLLKGLEKDRAAFLGPSSKPLPRLYEEVIRNPKVQKRIEAEARSSKKKESSIRRQALKELKKMGANPTRKFIRLIYHPFKWFLNKMYDGLVVDKEGIEEVRKVAREGTVVFLPSHKSHMDYLLLTYVLYDHALSTPLVAAGDNLSFWPLGSVLRRAGAFFIRRNFRGNKLYAALVEAYLRRILLEGHSVEFFIEGGRSRTGKLLLPQLGLLSMVVDVSIQLKKKIYFVPVSIGYERVIERLTYEEEIQGKEKETENIGDLIRAPEVLLSKHGQVNVQFGKIFRLAEVLHEPLMPQGESLEQGMSSLSLSPLQRREKIKEIANRVIEEIHRCTMVTPSSLIATSLLVHRHRGIQQEELLYLSSEILIRLKNDGVRPSPALDIEDGRISKKVLEKAIRIFVQDKLVDVSKNKDSVFYKVRKEGRLGLEYYKNTVSHFLIHRAVICTILELHGKHFIGKEKLKIEYEKILKYISPFFAEIPQDHFQQTLDGMLHQEELIERNGEILVGDEEMASLILNFSFLLRSYWETFWVVHQSLKQNVSGKPVSRREWMRKTLVLGRRMFQGGVVECNESVTKPKFEQALQYLRAQGLVLFEKQERLSYPPSEKRDVFEKELRQLLRIT